MTGRRRRGRFGSRVFGHSGRCTHRAVDWFADRGVTIERVSDNGAVDKSFPMVRHLRRTRDHGQDPTPQATNPRRAPARRRPGVRRPDHGCRVGAGRLRERVAHHADAAGLAKAVPALGVGYGRARSRTPEPARSSRSSTSPSGSGSTATAQVPRRRPSHRPERVCERPGQPRGSRAPLTENSLDAASLLSRPDLRRHSDENAVWGWA